MRSPAWMIAYAAMLVLLAGTYVSLVYLDSATIALLFALAALVAVLAAVALAFFR